MLTFYNRHQKLKHELQNKYNIEKQYLYFIVNEWCNISFIAPFSHNAIAVLYRDIEIH